MATAGGRGRDQRVLTFGGIGKFIAIGLLTIVAVVYAVNRPESGGGTLAGLTIVRIDSRSAGTYDGTFSARVTIYNGSGKTLRPLRTIVLTPAGSEWSWPKQWQSGVRPLVRL